MLTSIIFGIFKIENVSENVSASVIRYKKEKVSYLVGLVEGTRFLVIGPGSSNGYRLLVSSSL
jgi:hypothetical protein